MLDLPMDKWFMLEELVLISPRIARDYAQVNMRTVQRDLEELINLKLLEKNDEKEYSANLGAVLRYMAMRKRQGLG